MEAKVIFLFQNVIFFFIVILFHFYLVAFVVRFHSCVTLFAMRNLILFFYLVMGCLVLI